MTELPKTTRALFMVICAVLALWALSILTGCTTVTLEPSRAPYLFVLGTAQDGGYPQAGRRKNCCARAWQDPSRRRMVCSVAIIDPETDQRWLLDISPDFAGQLRLLQQETGTPAPPDLAGIFLTHAHIGHYAGLMFLGREVMGTKALPLHVMPRMSRFLRDNGPWSQLVQIGNVALQPLEHGVEVPLNHRLSITPLLVPHRDEFSETVGYRIQGPEAPKR